MSGLPSLPKTKNKIQNIVIIVAMVYVFGTSGAGFFYPEILEDDNGEFSPFQQTTLDNSSILIVVIISEAIGAIALDKRNDKQSEELIKKLIDKIPDTKPI